MIFQPAKSFTREFNEYASQGLQALANMKMEQLKRQQLGTQQAPFWQSQGYEPEAAKIIPTFAPNIQAELLKGKRLAGAFGKITQPTTTRAVPTTPITPEEGPIPSLGAGGTQSEVYSPEEQKILDDAAAFSEATGNPQHYINAERDVFKNKERRKSAEEKKMTAEQNARWKDAAPFLDKLAETTESALEQLKTVNDMRNEIAKGELPDPILYSFLNTWLPKIGITNVEALFGASAENMARYGKSFVKNLKNIFGSRPTQFDVEVFLKTFPTLATTDEGKMLMLEAIEIESKAKLLKPDITERIIEENGGVPPRNLAMQVLKKEREELPKLFQQFEQTGRKIVEYGKKYPINLNMYSSDILQKMKPGTVLTEEQAKRMPPTALVENEEGIKGHIINGEFVPVKDNNGI